MVDGGNEMTILSDEQLKDLVNCTPDQGVVDTGKYKVVKTWRNPHILHIEVYRYDEHQDGDSIEKWLVHAINGKIVEYEEVRTDEDRVIDRWTVESVKEEMV